MSLGKDVWENILKALQPIGCERLLNVLELREGRDEPAQRIIPIPVCLIDGNLPNTKNPTTKIRVFHMGVLVGLVTEDRGGCILNPAEELLWAEAQDALASRAN